MKNVGIFYHPSFSRKSYMTIGNRLRDFPEVLEPLLQRPNVRLFEAPRVSEELILEVHAPEMLTMVARDGFCSTAYESVGSVVAGMEALAKEEIDRAFCFIGAWGHHAGYGQFWGACCFNDVVIALTYTRRSVPGGASPSWTPTPTTATAPASWSRTIRRCCIFVSVVKTIIPRTVARSTSTFIGRTVTATLTPNISNRYGKMQPW